MSVVGKLLSELTLTPEERECSSVAGVILIFIGGETEAQRVNVWPQDTQLIRD